MKHLIVCFFCVSFSGLSQVLPTFLGIYKPPSQFFSNFNFDPNKKGSKIVLSNNNRTVGSTQAAGSSCQ